MPYADGPSGSESANNWLRKNVRFGSRPPATDQVNDFFGSLGKLKFSGPSSKNWLGSIGYEGPKDNRQMTSINGQAKKTKFTGWPAGRLSTGGSNSAPRNTDDQRDAAMSRRMQNQGTPPEENGRSFFDELMGEFQTQWGGVDKSKIDYSPLDNALKARMDAINGMRTQTNENFTKSDGNLVGMHDAFQKHISTDGAARYNNIHDTEKANLGQINSDSQARLQATKADDMAKRQAMLQNLGIEESGATPDSSADILTQTQGSIANRNEAEMVNAEQDRASSLAFNQGMAQSVGQQGVERRAALQQQLQGILGKLGMVEADAQSENAGQRFELEQNAGQQQYQQYRDRQGFLQDTLGMLQEDAQKQAEMQQGGDPLEVSGFSGLAQDLLNTGYDTPEIQNAMNTLAQVTATDYMKGVDPNAGYSQSAILNKILQQRGIDPMLSIQLATNYGNLGNTSKYQQQ